MARVEPLRALHYDQAVAGPLQRLVAPPYDVLDDEARAVLAARSPYNVVHVDLPRGDDPYAAAAETFARWRAENAVVGDADPALWALVQEYTAPDGRRLTRRGLFARVRVEEYGAGRIRPHERTHPGPREDRLRLTRATRTNLSPIFSLYSDPGGAAWAAIDAHTATTPVGETTDDEGTVHRLWRIADQEASATVCDALEDAELLIADGHHRYETARVYADEVGGDGPHRFVLMCLVALEDEGLTVFPTHRLLSGLAGDSERQEALAATLREHFELERVADDAIAPPAGRPQVTLGYMDSHFRQAFRLTLKDQASADAALPGLPEAYRRVDTAVLEALVLKGPLRLDDDDISHLRGLSYARSTAEALELVRTGAYDAAFFLAPAPIGQVRDVAAAGRSMPPKSTYFHPKVPTGFLFYALAAPG